MKKTLCFLFSILLIINANLSFTSANSTDNEALQPDDSYYVETVISDTLTDNYSISVFALNTITRTKTAYVKNSAGAIMWSVSITATFTYNGSTATCIKCSDSTTCPSQTWDILTSSSSRSGNTATAKASATHTTPDGILKCYNQSVTITCSPSGVIS